VHTITSCIATQPQLQMANKEANCEHILNTFCILQAIHGSSQRCPKDYSTIARPLSGYNNTQTIGA